MGEAGRSLGVHLSGDKAGIWADFAGNQRGDLIDLIGAVRGVGKGQAVAWAKQWLGLSSRNEYFRCQESVSRQDIARKAKRKSIDADTACRTRIARALWERGTRASGSLVQVYLQSRAITTEPPPSLRFVAALKHKPTALIFPGMVAAIQAPDRSVCSVHRVYLRADGIDKAPISQPKMTLGPMSGGAVRLGRAVPELGICEGIESGLSAMQLYGLPVWCALGGGNMAGIILPDNVKRIVIYGDNGKAGQDHAKRAAWHFYNEGRHVRLSFPPEEHGDFNDLLKFQNGGTVT
jgi:DNA primase